MHPFFRRLLPLLPFLILPLAGLAVYWTGLHGTFIFDDFPNLVNNPVWKITSLSPEEWLRPLQAGIASDVGRPLAMLSFGVNHYFTGMDPFWLRLTGLGMHIVNGLLVYVLCVRLFGLAGDLSAGQVSSAEQARHYGEAGVAPELARGDALNNGYSALVPSKLGTTGLGRYAALLVALAWLLHPLQVSSALYVVQRMEVGAHTFVLLSLLAYLRGRLACPTKTCRASSAPTGKEGANSPHVAPELARGESIGITKATGKPGATRATPVRWGWLVLAAVLPLLGLGFKETALLAPGYALLVELCLLHFRGTDGKVSRPLVAIYAIGTTLALAVFAFKFLPAALQPWAYAGRHFSLGERLLTQLPVLTLYLQQILLPLPDTLRFYYDNYPVSTGLLSPPATLRGLLVLAGLVAIALATYRRAPLVTLGIGWFFMGHALTSNVWPLELVFEHRNYFALLGILIAVAQGLAWLTRTLHVDARRTLAVLPVALLAVLCAIQTHTWGNPMRLSMALATRGIDSPRASYDLGRTFLVASGYDADSPLFSLARKEFEHASTLPNASPLADQALILMDAKTGQAVPDARWDALRQKLATRYAGPQERMSLSSLADCRFGEGCRFDDVQLMRSFITALERNPGSADLHTMYGFFAINTLGDAQLAAEMGREAVRLAPRTVQYQANLAKFLAASGQSPEELDALITQITAANRHGRWDGELAEIARLRTIRQRADNRP